MLVKRLLILLLFSFILNTIVYSQSSRVPIRNNEVLNICNEEGDTSICNFPINPFFQHSVGMNYSWFDVSQESKIEGIALKFRQFVNWHVSGFRAPNINCQWPAPTTPTVACSSDANFPWN